MTSDLKETLTPKERSDLKYWSIAYNRFGFGARGADPAAQGDPREALKAEIASGDAALLSDPGLPYSAAALVKLYEFGAAREAWRARADVVRAAATAMPNPEAAARLPGPNAPPDVEPPNPVGPIVEAEARARFEAACKPRIGLAERLVAFWSNHFCVSAAKGPFVRIVAGAFEREAIRPFVLGRFADMLRAVEQHPAMQRYLDNVQSVGPDSRIGKAANKGLNENLAREILELHTLGVGGGYAQGDVTEFARVLTGWTVVGREGGLGEPGAFVFNANAHEGGERDLLGRRYGESGMGQGEAVLDDLARSPATARHLAFKFARAFVADTPPPALVDRLTAAYTRSDGDLGAMTHALLDDDLAWSAPATKIRDPWQMLVAASRALNLETLPTRRLLGLMNMLGMPLWSPAGPNGYPDIAEAWLSPESVRTRVEAATVLAGLAKEAASPRDLIDRALPGAPDTTRQAVLRAPSQTEAYALLVLSPEFQRR